MGYKKRAKARRSHRRAIQPRQYSEKGPWCHALVGKPLDGEILREMQEEFESYPEYNPDSVRRAEQYFRYEGYPYTITVVMAE